MNKSGIYKIQSKIKPDRIYIGSAIDINHRWRSHLTDLEKGRHHNIKIQRHYNKYGETDLIFSIIINCNKKDLLKKEQYYIDYYKPYFNICKKAGSLLGFKRTKETNKKQSETRKKKFCTGELVMIISQEGKNKRSATLMGHSVSEESKEKNRLKHLGKRYGHGRLHTEETKEKIRQKHLGKTHSIETRKKMSLSQKGIKRGNGRLDSGKMVVNITTGKIFKTITAVAKYENIKYSTIYAQLLGVNPNNTNYKLIKSA